MQMQQPAGRVAYEPNSLSQDSPRESAAGFASAAISGSGEKGRIRAESFADHYSQARQFFISQTSYEQSHIASALVFELSKVEHLHIRQAMVGHLRHISQNLAERVSAGLGLEELPAAAPVSVKVQEMPPSPALQTIGKMQDTLLCRVVAILVAEGSDVVAVNAVKNAAIKAGAYVKIIAPKMGSVRGSDGVLFAVDGQLAGSPSVLFDAVAIILASEGAKTLSMEAAAIDFVRDAFAHLKTIAVDKGGDVLLAKANISRDAGVVSATELDAFIAAAKTRQWDREKSVRTLA